MSVRVCRSVYGCGWVDVCVWEGGRGRGGGCRGVPRGKVDIFESDYLHFL